MEWDRQGLRRWVPAGLIWLGIALLDALGTVTSMREQGRASLFTLANSRARPGSAERVRKQEKWRIHGRPWP
jgi:hypothetical protein